MKCLIVSFLLSAAISVPFVPSSTSVGFRGGGLFDKLGGSSSSSGNITESQTYPAMTQAEVEAALQHIPIFAVTNADGNGIVLRPQDESSGNEGVFYFFLSPNMANQTLNQLTGSGGNETEGLRISAFSLGKIYFMMKAKAAANATSTVKGVSADTSAAASVSYRLVPDMRDLMGARMLLTMDEKDSEELRKAGETGEISEEITQKAMQKALTESSRFNNSYGEVPVFLIQQMRMQRTKEGLAEANKKAKEEGLPDVQPHMLPMYFNLQAMVTTWQSFIAKMPDAKDVEPSIHLMDLDELVSKMMEESEIDFRSVLLVPSGMNPGAEGLAGAAGAAAGGATAAAATAMPSVGGGGGGTVGDL